ncbi:family with sequence similarity 98 member C, partial [Homo sapiens]
PRWPRTCWLWGMEVSRGRRRGAPHAQTSGGCACGWRRSWRRWAPSSSSERRARRC